LGSTGRTIAILAGSGLRRNSETDLADVASKWHIPVATTLGAKGILPEDHPMSLGVFGYGGSRWATDLIMGPELEILIVIGSALSHLSATNIGPMGAAIPMKVGSAAARPDVPHLTITGDGCMLMHGMELHTAVAHQQLTTLLVLNNRSYGNIW